MAANTIGAVTCDIVRGFATALKQRVRVEQREGMDGYGGQELGLGDARFEFMAVKFNTRANVLTWIAALEAVQGTEVTIENGAEDQFTKCFVQRVQNVQVLTVRLPANLGEVRARGIALVVGVRRVA